MKVLLIATFFMHLRLEGSTPRLIAIVGLIRLTILVAGTLDDVVTRGWLPAPGK